MQEVIKSIKNFSITELESLSTIRAHTFRIWEKRYGICIPCRSLGNVRNYSLRELQYLLNITLLNRCGYKISHLVNMDGAAIDHRIAQLTDDDALQCKYIHDLIIAMYRLDAEKMDDILETCIAMLGHQPAMNAVIFPFLERLQLFSCRNQIKEVHFIVAAIRRKMILAIETLPMSRYSEKSALLFLPKGEHFDLLLLYYHYIMKKMGIRVWYMGTNVPTEDLIEILAVKVPDILLTYLRPKEIPNAPKMFEKVVEKFPRSLLYITGPMNQENREANNLRFMHYKELPLHLDAICTG